MTALRFTTVLIVMLAGCSRQSAPVEEVKHYSIHGQIVRLDEKDKLATIKHQKIEGFMGAMTMDFPVRDDKEFSSLHEGDKIVEARMGAGQATVRPGMFGGR